MSRPTASKIALRVVCPTCAASLGLGCRDGRRAVPVHAERISRAQALGLTDPKPRTRRRKSERRPRTGPKIAPVVIKRLSDGEIVGVRSQRSIRSGSWTRSSTRRAT